MIEKDSNPFINTLAIPYNEVVKHISTGGINRVIDSYEYELDSSVKVYNSKDNREYLFKKLTMYARDLYLAMLHWVNRDYDYVIMSYEKVLELYGTYSKRRYDDTIKELIRFNIIDCKNKIRNQYWYNPSLFCSGNRLKMFPQCKVKKATVTQEYIEETEGKNKEYEIRADS